MPYVDNQGVRIHFEIEGEGLPLVLQHGFTGSIKTWYQSGYVDELKKDYQLILIDARGHGASDKPHDAAAYAWHLRTKDIVSVLDNRQIKKAHFFGYSMGGAYGFTLAKYAPERVDSLIIGGAQPYALSFAAFRDVDGTDAEKFITALESFVGRQLTPEFEAKVLTNDLQALAAAAQDRPSLESVLPTMTMSCLLFAGKDDLAFPKVKKCAAQIPHATFVSLPNCNHAQAFTRADLVLPHVREFLIKNKRA